MDLTPGKGHKKRTMSMFDFFFPEQAQAMHLRTIAESGRSNSLYVRSKQIAENNLQRQALRLRSKTDERVAELEKELGQSALVIEALITLLEEKGVVARDELKVRVADIDSADGVVDGRITPSEKKPFTPAREWPGGNAEG